TLATDITEHKKAEEAIKHAAQEWRTTFDSIRDLIAVIDLDYRIVRLNRSFAGAFHAEPKELLGKSCHEIFHGTPTPCENCRLKTVQETGGTCKEEHYEPKLGIYFETTFSPIFNDKGEVVSFVHISRDITERKVAEEKLRQLDTMKTEFLSNVSHELRTPLQSISGFTRLMLDGQVPDTETQQEFLQIVDRETLHLGNLINSLLDLSRLESGRFKINKRVMPVRQIIDDSINSFFTLARDKKIAFTEEIPPDLPEMDVDGERLRQVLINLIGNAIKFTDPGGRVDFRVIRENGNLLFKITDNGIGISGQDMQHLFERFYRARDEKARGGTGLGLFISKQIVEAHGGHIWAESQVGQGSVFSVTLPVNHEGETNHVVKDSPN
ncbi:MAG: hypothetical protein A2137_04450, partial [Chloroflexi bacterium RBG_16_58_8]